MFDSNTFLMNLVSNNWLAILAVYGVFRAVFPNSRILSRLADYFSGLFPILKNRKLEG
jgi:hypothetical protein